MVQVDIPAAFAMGQILAMAGRKSLKMGNRSAGNGLGRCGVSQGRGKGADQAGREQVPSR